MKETIFTWTAIIASVLTFGGYDYETTYEFSADEFEDMTVEDMSEITDFFPDIDEWLRNESISIIMPAVDKVEKTYGYYDYEDLEEIMDKWQRNRETFEKHFERINQDLVAAFKNLKELRIDDENFCDFLDGITFHYNKYECKISSYYGTRSYSRI